jgi:MFS superfamily sulfate permease-like transporter
MGLQGDALIFIEENPLKHGITLPNFYGLWNDSSLWTALVTTVVTLTLIDGIESLATVMAIDKIDPFHRKSDPNRTLQAMGVSNIVSSMAGGLTIIPGGVKSTACIMGGGRTQWANFYNACFLLVYLLLARPVINLMPYSVLAAMLIFTGYKLCRPKVWMHVAHIGWEQLAIFTITVVATLTTDLLWGIIIGISAKWLLAAWLHATIASPLTAASNGHGATLGQQPSWLARLFQTFRSPVVESQSIEDEHHVYFGGPLVSFNLLHVKRELGKTTSFKKIYLHLTDRVTIVDHTSCETLMHFADECHRNGGSRVELLGLDAMTPRSNFPSCMRTRKTRSANGRPQGSEAHFATPGNERTSAGAELADHELSASAIATDDLTWLSLSDPAATDSKPSELSDREAAARARAEMDWIDLELASDGFSAPGNRSSAGRATMEWLSLVSFGWPGRPSGA